ncbi:MAG: hypothetical protein ACE5EG_05590 [Thermoanaerobaculia bacterium]
MSQDSFRYGGARALVTLHERHLREFLGVWRQAEDRRVELPETTDPNYASRAALLAHVLGAAARYLTWICKQLDVPAPVVEVHPDPEGLPGRAQEYLDDVLRAWRRPLRELTEERAYAPAHISRWGPPYCIDAMLEHAVMHPIRHTYQLRELMGRADG